MSRADAVLRAAARRLADHGVPEPMRDARRLLAHVMGRVFAQDDVAGEDRATFERLVARRCAREPLSHLTGQRAFWAHDFEVSAAVLDPRPETELLVAEALRGPFATVLDLGTGSGAIILSLLAERPDARGVAVDLSEAALAVAARNAARLGVADRVSLLFSDWFGAVTGRYDLIVSNPPYIARAEMDGLAPELSHEPRIALSDEGDGLSAYRAIAAGAGDHLAPDGRLLVEIGPSQAEAVCGLFSEAGLSGIAVHRDLDDRDRVVEVSAHHRG